jgi:hypothetical protein
MGRATDHESNVVVVAMMLYIGVLYMGMLYIGIIWMFDDAGLPKNLDLLLLHMMRFESQLLWVIVFTKVQRTNKTNKRIFKGVLSYTISYSLMNNACESGPYVKEVDS